MDTFYIPNEGDIKRWIKEAVKEYFQEDLQKEHIVRERDTALLNRKEVAKFLRISLPTLTDWIKKGLPSHKQGGRVYFDKFEVLNYIKESKMGQFKFRLQSQTLRHETT